MSFMVDEVIYETFLVGETSEGTTSLHPDVWSERRHYKLITGERWKKAPGWYARKSAPGYLDATDWMGPFDSEREALDELRDLYDGDPIEDDWTEIRDEMEAIRHKIGELMDRIGDIGVDCDSEEENHKLGAIQSALGDAHGLILSATP